MMIRVRFVAALLLASVAGCCCCDAPEVTSLSWHDRPASDWVADLAKPDARARQEAIDALTAIGPDMVPLLDVAFADKDPATRFAAANVLVNLRCGAVDGVHMAITALGDADPGVRAEAAYAIERMGSKAHVATPALRAALCDSDWYVRWHAANAIGNMGRYAQHSIERLDFVAHNDMEIRVRAACADAITAIRADDLRAEHVQLNHNDAE